MNVVICILMYLKNALVMVSSIDHLDISALKDTLTLIGQGHLQIRTLPLVIILS